MTLIERDAELQRVRACAREAEVGRGGMVVIEGEPGIGKTALLEAAVAEAAGRVLTARASELERGFPFGVVRQLFERAVAGRDELFVGRAGLAEAVLGPVPAGADVRATEGTLHGLYWLLAELADDDAVLLAVDDLHWIDAESLDFLRFLAVRLGGLRVAVLLTTRPVGPQDPAGSLLADPAVEMLRPHALAAAGAAAFLALRLGREPEPRFADVCHAAAGGNPFLLGQLAAALQAAGIEPVAAQADRVAELRPDGLARSLVGRLDAAARAVAAAVAILGDDVDAGLAAALAGVAAREAEPAADALAAAGVLVDARPLRFRHALLRSAVLAGMRAGEQARWHERAIETLRERGAAPERVAAHVLAIAPRDDPADAATLRAAAADALARGATASAASLLARALGEALDADGRAAVLLALGRAELGLGRPAAVDHLLEAAGLTDGELQVTAAIEAGAGAPLNPGRVEDVMARLDALQADGADRETAVRVLGARVIATWFQPGRHRRIASEADALEPLLGESAAECLLLAQLARITLETGGTAEETGRRVERALHHPTFGETSYLVPAVMALTAVDRHDEADRLLQQAIDHATEHGVLRTFQLALFWQARNALTRGDLARAESLAQTALDAVQGAVMFWALLPVAVLTEVRVERGRTSGLAVLWERAGIGDAVPEHRALNQLLHARARWRAAEGDLAGALTDLREIARRVGPSAGTMGWHATAVRTAELLHAVGEVDEARTTSAAAVERARAFGAASALGFALRVHGRTTGDEAVLAEAVDVLRGAPTRLEYARGLIDLGAVMRRRGARREARDPLREGHDLAVACGAAPDVERARSELAASGVHVERLDATRRDELTPSELRIATMAAEGRSNKEVAQALFLTVKTVEMHLSSAYRKLEVRSRRDLPAALAERA